MKRIRECVGRVVYNAGIALLLLSAWIGGKAWFNREFGKLIKR